MSDTTTKMADYLTDNFESLLRLLNGSSREPFDHLFYDLGSCRKCGLIAARCLGPDHKWTKCAIPDELYYRKQRENNRLARPKTK